MNALAIDRVRVYAVGPPVERYRWAHDMKPQFVTLTLLRVTTKGGLEGIGAEMTYGGLGFDATLAETLRLLAPALLGRNALDRAPLRAHVLHEGGGASSQALGMMDIALWDIAGRHAGLPIWKMLGGARETVPAYASTNTLDDAEAYVDHVAEILELGYTAIKFHCFCDYAQDSRLVEAVHKAHGSKGLRLMLDVEQRYSREEALRMAHRLEELDYAWFEAPLPDVDLAGYAELRRRTSLPILPAGNSILALPLLAHALEMGCWSALRVAAARVGGIGEAVKAVALAEAHNLPAELQSWGYTPVQAANLHLMLGLGRTAYFEQPYPYSALEYGAKTVIRPNAEGLVRAPDGNGLGIKMDWDALARAAIASFDFSV